MKYLLYPGCDSPFPPSCSLPCLENFLARFCQSHPSYNTELRTHLFHEASPEDKKDSPALTRDNRHARLHFELQSWIQPLFLASGRSSKRQAIELLQLHQNSGALAQPPAPQAITKGVTATQEALSKTGKPFMLVSICLLLFRLLMIILD
ncbi:hypothetical protein CapIbe_012283 [Capra ibex]